MLSKFFGKKNQDVKILKKGKAKISKSMRDYSSEDFFVKKAEAAREVLAKYGLPNDLLIKE